MAVINEAVWRNSTTDFWIAFKLWGAVPATLLFAVANVPMLMRHGLSMEDETKPVEPGPVE
jgi:intracellular septation protein